MRFLRPLAYGAGSLTTLILLFSRERHSDSLSMIVSCSLFLFGLVYGIAACCQLIMVLFSMNEQQRRAVTFYGCAAGALPALITGTVLIIAVGRVINALP